MGVERRPLRMDGGSSREISALMPSRTAIGDTPVGVMLGVCMWCLVCVFKVQGWHGGA